MLILFILVVVLSDEKGASNMKLVIMTTLFLLLLMALRANGADNGTLNAFIKDIITTFRMTSPTIVYSNDEEVPEICYTNQWVSCLNSGLTSFYQDEGRLFMIK